MVSCPSEFSVYSQAWNLYFYCTKRIISFTIEPTIEAYYVIFEKLFGIIALPERALLTISKHFIFFNYFCYTRTSPLAIVLRAVVSNRQIESLAIPLRCWLYIYVVYVITYDLVNC